MTPDEFKQRISLGEDARTEFKEEPVRPDALAAAIVSFANSAAGGAILLGVADDGRPAGVADADTATVRIDDICRQNVEPPLTNVTIERHRLGDATLLAVYVPRGPQRPYRTSSGIYYVRGTAGRRIATRQELLEIYQSSQALFPDEMAVEDAGPGDLDPDYLRALRPELQGLAEPELLRTLVNLKILFDTDHPTLGGLLCFGKEPQRLRSYARITAIRQRGTDVTEDFIDRREIGGHLERQLRDAEDFVRRHLPGPAAGSARPIYPPPVEAVDEALVNAAAHRDYLAAAQIRLFIFDDRVEVISPGRLLNDVSPELMRHGCHVVRNPVVFSHLARLRLATDAGRGVPTMFTVMRARGLPEPEIVPAGAELRVVLKLT